MLYKIQLTNDHRFVYPTKPGNIESNVIQDHEFRWPGAYPFDQVNSDLENKLVSLHFFPEHELQRESFNVVLRPHLRFHFANVRGTDRNYDFWVPGGDFTRAASKWRIGGMNIEQVMSKLAQALVRKGNLTYDVERILRDLHMDYAEQAIKFIDENFTRKFQVSELAPRRWQILMDLLDRETSIWSTAFEFTSKDVDNLLANINSSACVAA